MPADYHTHTPLCHHAEGEPEAYIDAAVAAGVSEYGVSDHAPQLPEPFDDWRMAVADLPEYFRWLERARAHAAGRIPVRAGKGQVQLVRGRVVKAAPVEDGGFGIAFNQRMKAHANLRVGESGSRYLPLGGD